MNNICIYRHIKNNGEVFYIGIGSLKRPYNKYKRSKFWKNITSKESYEIDILKKNLSWEEAYELEKILISYYGRRDLNKGTLVNHTDGGEGCSGLKHSSETKYKLSIINKGKTLSKEHKEKMSKSRTGMIRSTETRLKISNSHKNLNIFNKRVINTITGEIYNSIKECSMKNNINYSTLKHTLTGIYKENKTIFKLLNKD